MDDIDFNLTLRDFPRAHHLSYPPTSPIALQLLWTATLLPIVWLSFRLFFRHRKLKSKSRLRRAASISSSLPTSDLSLPIEPSSISTAPHDAHTLPAAAESIVDVISFTGSSSSDSESHALMSSFEAMVFAMWAFCFMQTLFVQMDANMRRGQVQVWV